jgi:hypothetical protein
LRAGWVYGNSAYLISDSAITDGPRRETISTFGEDQGGPPVEETTLKIGRVGPGIAVAYAGNMELASQICGHIRDLISQGAWEGNAETLFEKVNCTYYAPNTSDSSEVQLLLAISGVGVQPSVVRWVNKTGKCEAAPHDDFLHIGQPILRSIRQQLALFKRKNDAEDKVLTTVLAYVQKWTIQTKAILNGVGGAIFGLRTTNGESIWKDDTLWIFYDSVGAPMLNVVFAIFRNDIAMVFSTYKGRTKRYFAFWFPSSLTHDEFWAKKIKSLPEDNLTRLNDWIFCICIAKSDTRITIVERKDVLKPSEMVYFDNPDPQRGTLQLNRIAQYLQRPGSRADAEDILYIRELTD